MSDYMRNLPLSWKERRDESDVHSDWRAELDEVLAQGEAISAGLGDGASDAADALAASLRALGADSRARRKVPVRLLARGVLDLLALAREASVRPPLAERTGGAVALYLAAKAPTEIRAVTRGHALRATDADWEFGHGPVLEAPAVEMIEFLAGRSLSAPRPAAPEGPAAPPAPR
ncbi:hypothetical protein GE115_17505 [Agromyces sp. CFH 90414]|uniref:Uncharacterized protein n=1 Tax=Agromyces agglutinans TaxID=2662258 RepID=A0A6I2FLZ5_9MICO|nr:hypothetical protein [Agromyces agglutinans]MRG61658.1 hypothetical protein [Agromyces agglutinans]